MSDTPIADQLDEIADGLSGTNMLRARQMRPLIAAVAAMERNRPLPMPMDPQPDCGGLGYFDHMCVHLMSPLECPICRSVPSAGGPHA
jgi:hypothetical protein